MYPDGSEGFGDPSGHKHRLTLSGQRAYRLARFVIISGFRTRESVLGKLPNGRGNKESIQKMQKWAILVPAGLPCTSVLPMRCCLHRPQGAGRGRASGASARGGICACYPPAPDLASSQATNFPSADELRSPVETLTGSRNASISAMETQAP